MYIYFFPNILAIQIRDELRKAVPTVTPKIVSGAATIAPLGVRSRQDIWKLLYLIFACLLIPSLAILFANKEVLYAFSAISLIFLASFSSFSARRRDSFARADISTDCLPNWSDLLRALANAAAPSPSRYSNALWKELELY